MTEIPYMPPHKKCRECSKEQRDICKGDPTKKLECIQSEFPRTFGECLSPLVRQKLESGQNLDLTRFELTFPTWQEQHSAIAYYLKNEHRINTVALLHKIERCERTSEHPLEVWLRFRGHFTQDERDIIAGEWCRKYGWGIRASKVTRKEHVKGQVNDGNIIQRSAPAIPGHA